MARCLTSAANTILWRCWSDKLLFEVKGIDATNTQIGVYAVPNLLRFKVKQREKTIELKELVSRLFQRRPLLLDLHQNSANYACSPLGDRLRPRENLGLSGSYVVS